MSLINDLRRIYYESMFLFTCGKQCVAVYVDAAVEDAGPRIAGDGIRTDPLTGRGRGERERASMPVPAYDFMDDECGVSMRRCG